MAGAEVFEDGQRLGGFRARRGVIKLLAIEQRVGVQQPGLAVWEGHGFGAVQAFGVGG